ncbi:MAG: hypothetical protein V4857_22080 [Pseudomonadota bacterium]
MNQAGMETTLTNEAKAAREASSFIGSLRLNPDGHIAGEPVVAMQAQTGSSMRDAYFSYELI